MNECMIKYDLNSSPLELRHWLGWHLDCATPRFDQSKRVWTAN